MRKSAITLSLVILIVLEDLFLFIFFKKGITRQATNAWGLFLSSLLIGIIIFFKFYNKAVEENVPAATVVTKRKNFARWFLTFAALVWAGCVTNNVISEKPIDVHFSDIIPSIQLIIHQLLTGQHPYSYRTLSSIGFHSPPGYLPMHWLPYTIAQVGHFDYRWITYSIWSIAVIVLIMRCRKIQSTWVQMSIPILLGCSFYVITQLADSILAHTVEIMVSGYYMLLIVGLNQRSAFLQGMFITFCLLSRYSVALWLPLWAFILFVSNHRKELIISAITIAILICVIYIIPFLSPDWSTFYAAHLANYEVNAMGEWYHNNEHGLPYHLFSGHGLAYMFYEKYISTDLKYGYELLKKTLFISLISSSFLMGLWYWFNKEKIHYRIFMLVTFKIYLSIFLALILIPYQYLMVTGNFVSIALFAEQARYRLTEKA